MSTPYLYTDLLSPNSLQNSVADGDEIVRTWSNGSPPLKGKTGSGKKTSPIAKSYESDFHDEELDAYLANLNLVTNANQEANNNHSGIGVDNIRGVMMPNEYPEESFYSQTFEKGSLQYGEEDQVVQGEEDDGEEDQYYEDEEEAPLEGGEEGDDDDLDNYIEYEGSDAHQQQQEEEEENQGDEEQDGEDDQKEDNPDAVFSALKDFNDMFDDPSRFHTSYDSVLRYGDFGKEIGLDRDEDIEEEPEEQYDNGQVFEEGDYEEDEGFEQDGEDEEGDDNEEEDGEDEEDGEEDDEEDDDEENDDENEGDDGDEEDPEQADDRELNKIVNDYTELLSYMDSPREKDQKFMQENLNIMIRSRNIIQAQQKQALQAKQSSPVQAMNPKPSQPDFANILLPMKKKDKNAMKDNKNKAKKDKNRSAKSSNYGNNKKGKKKGPVDKAAMKEVAMRHRAMLASLSNKRKQEEEELQQLMQQEQEKRKKFRDNLLEKALKARQEQQANGGDRSESDEDVHILPKMPKLPEKITKKKKDPSAPPPVVKQTSNAALPVSSSLLQPTTAYKNQSIVKTAQEVVLTDEQLAQQEEAKREYIAMIRRKFKEQHKKILSQLAAKKKEQEDKTEQEQMLEEQKRQMRKKKLLKMLADKPPVEHATEPQPAQPARVQSGRRNPSSFLTQKDGSNVDDTPNSKSKKAAGSALAVVRQRSQQSTGGAGERRKNEEDLSGSDDDVSPPEYKAATSSKSQRPPQPPQGSKAAGPTPVINNKLQEYLQNISEQRKQEELAKKKMEDRQKKRMQLLSQRLLQEASERKLMMMEDKLKYRDVNSKDEAPVEKKVKKITPEQAEAITNRLRGQQKTTATTEASNPQANEKPEKPVKKLPPRPSVERAAVISSSVANNSEVVPSSSSKESSNVSTVPARDFNDWKRKNGVPNEGKVFCMTGWYPCVKQALLDRGWYFNADPTSPFFHLKWTLRSIDVNQDTLQPWQLTNHYLKNVAITTKAGLIKSLQSLVWLADVDSSDIIPRAYDLSINHDMRAFLDDFRGQKAEAVLKKLYFTLTGKESAVEVDKLQYYSGSLSSRRATSRQASSRATSANGNVDIAEKSSTFYDAEVDLETQHEEKKIPPTPALKEGVDITTIQINAVVFEACCHLLESLLRPVDDDFLDEDEGSSQRRSTSLLDQSLLANDKAISDLDWELVNNYSLYASVGSLPFDAPEPVDHFLRGKEDEYQELATGKSSNVSSYQQQQLQQQLTREKKKLAKLYEELRDDASHNIRQMRSVTIADLERIHKILSKLHYYHGNQFGINGKASLSENIWIVKPAAKSRGRGITTFNDLPKLLKYVEAGSGLSTQWIVQKYMENPLIIAKRKFDLRQWVLVTDWNPLTIYFYNECYARFSVEEYSIDHADLDNCYIHLVNNSIGKNSEHFGRTIIAENGKEIDGCMWSFDDFKEYIQFKSGKDLVTHKIMPRMKDIAKWSLMCASEMIEHRKNSWELYGFDYMIDDNYNAWLIEINSSPACDYSTKVTERYVQKALVELLSVVLDVREWEAQPKKTRGERPATGDWECIYQGPLLDMPVGSFGTEISLKGEGLKSLRPKPNPIISSSNVSFGNPPSADNDGSTSFKRPQAGGISYHVTGNGSSKKPTISNAGGAGPAAYGIKREDSVTRRTLPNNERKPSIVNDDIDDGNFNDSDDDSVKKVKPFGGEKRSPSENEPSSIRNTGDSGNGSRRDRNAKASAAPAKTSHASAIPANAAAIPVKVFNVEF